MIEANLDMRPSGIPVLGEMPWGTHFCQFYQTKRHLREVLVPYFQKGLEHNEFCVWVTSEALTADEAREALSAAVPDLAEREARGQFEVFPYNDWYMAGGHFDMNRILEGWREKYRIGLERGFEGLRVSGNTAWLESGDWESFSEYEQSIDGAIEGSRILVLCTYSLDRCGPYELLDVVRNHQFALVLGQRGWERIENAELRRVRELHQASEQRVRRQNAVLTGINRIFQEALSCRTEEQLGRTCLAVAEEITASKFAILGEIGADGVLHDIAISDPGWEACRMIDPAGHRRVPGNFAIHGIYGGILSGGKPVLTNDPDSHPDRIGLPPGHPRLTAFLGVPLVSGGRTIGMIAVANREGGYEEDDVQALESLAPAIVEAFERNRAETGLLQAKAAADAANQAKGRFLANMSHELRTPMNAILGMIDLALPKATDPTVQDCLQTAKGSADLLLTLLNDLLDSAKIESGKMELESAPFSLRRMLDQVARVLSVRAGEKGLRFGCRMPEGAPDALLGDRLRLQQVLLNLAGNAIKFTERGEVEIGVHVEEEGSGFVVQGSRSDGQGTGAEIPCVAIQFSVRDTGIGIPRACLERLFEPFGQADASVARRFGGTGLGLSIANRLVEMMGGRIGVKSQVDKGSTFAFTVRLPLAQEVLSDPEAPVAVSPGACAPLRILLVEDNAANQKLARYILEDRGHSVEIAGDGQEAVDLAGQNRYDAILMDVQMPGMDGLEAAAVIRQRESADGKGDGANLPERPEGCFSPMGPVPFSRPRVPIIAMTAHAMKGDRERCLAAGLDGYLAKPIQAQEMIGLVESLARDGSATTQLAKAGPGPIETAPPSTALVFNPEEALKRCFNSRSMVREMVQYFLDDVDRLLPRMRAALEKGDFEEAGRLGHRMKGTVVYLGAEPAGEAALAVERLCASSGGGPSKAEDAVRALERECLALKAALTGHPLAAEPT